VGTNNSCVAHWSQDQTEERLGLEEKNYIWASVVYLYNAFDWKVAICWTISEPHLQTTIFFSFEREQNKQNQKNNSTVK